ncbi:MAG: ion transporter [Candidatus Paceibacterota bacterium]
MLNHLPLKRTRSCITTTQHGLLYETTLGFLAILSVLLLSYELLGEPNPVERYVILSTDFAIAWIFLADFVIGFWVSANRDRYAKQNWLNLVSSVPIHTEMIQALRILRLVRTLRIIRALSAMSNAQRIKHVLTDTFLN